ncbi:zinc finger protein 808-like [Electrophorus electricus]|uniref:C2H2-type domain-containing protein n=1 Tax=Electrophorus electricus TaxID=8005 RepID=A0A4W4GVE8_ELEEL|nr:zinc finger protein 808-like [Electrophorus electricus]XP_026873086.2 zinc finger protein 808-like [Electrophorus electricus]
MAKSAFHARLSSIMEVMTESAMKQICEVVDGDLQNLRLQLTRALNENVALNDKMHVLENEVKTLRNEKTEALKKCRSICIQTLEVSDSPSINGIFGKEWCSSLWDRKEPRTEEKAGDVGPPVSDEPNDSNKMIPIKEEKCEKEIYPSNTKNKKEEERRKNPFSPSNHKDGPKVDLDEKEEEDDDADIYLISAGFEETPEVHPIIFTSPGADSSKIECVNSTREHLTVPSSDRMKFDEHCVPIEFIAAERTERQPAEEQGEVGPQDQRKDAGKILRSRHIFIVAQAARSKEKKKATLRCSDCSKMFIRQSNLTLHRKKFHQTYTCRVCKVIFPHKKLLRVHRCRLADSFATSDLRFSCEQCGKRFHSKANLRVHYAVHTGESPYTCSFCERGFTHKGYLKTHERAHSDERPYACVTCGRQFSQKANLIQHLVVHNKRRRGKPKKPVEKSQ